MGTATARARAARRQPRPASVRAARPERARIREVERGPVTAAERMRAAKAEAMTFGEYVLYIAVGFAVVFALLALRITAMHYALQSHKLKVQIEEATQMKENLEAKVAIMASSPKIQRQAIDSLGMIPASDFYYVKKRAQVSSKLLAQDMKYFDKTAPKVRAYRLALAQAALEKKKAAEAARDGGAVNSADSGKAQSSAGQSAAAGTGSASDSQVALVGGGGTGGAGGSQGGSASGAGQ